LGANGGELLKGKKKGGGSWLLLGLSPSRKGTEKTTCPTKERWKKGGLPRLCPGGNLPACHPAKWRT